MKIIPVEGRTVRDPVTHKIVTSEIEVPNDVYWNRRVRDGDVEKVLPVQEENN